MAEQPTKRLVIHSNADRDPERSLKLTHQQWYARLVKVKIKRLLCGLLTLPVGLAGLALSLWLLRYAYVDICLQCLVGVLLGTFIVFSYSFSQFSEANQIRPVRPNTPEYAPRLAPDEILVRPSALPSSQQPTELLRAARPGLETPTRELLRATSGTGEKE